MNEKHLLVYIVTDLLRAIIVESQQPSVARQRPLNSNNAAVFSVGSAPAITSCSNSRAIGGGVFYWALAEAL
jgi:hypothetical protein